MLKLLLTVIGLLVLGGGPVWFYDHHPHWQVNMPDPLPGHIGLPDSLATQRDKALAAAAAGQAALSQCHTNTEALKAAVEAQNSAVDALKAQGDTMKAENARAVSSARAVAESERQRAADILAQQSSDPDRCRAADALILKEAGR